IKNPLWIIAALKTAGLKALPTSFPPPLLFPCPARGGGQGGARGSRSRSASPGTFVGKLAVGLVAAFVDAFQALGDHCLQFPDLVLLLGVFRIHQCAAVT